MRAAIILAAGRSSRFGRRDKLFAPLAGIPLLLHAIRAARAAPAGRVIVVAGRPGRVRALIRRDGITRVDVVAARRGAPLSVSLRAGIAALTPIERDAFIFLGDMPGVDPRIAAMLARRLAPKTVAARPRHRGVPGHPVLIRNVRTAVAPRGDAGFRLPPGRVAWIEGRRQCVLDVDSAGDLARLRRLRLAR